MYYNFVKFQVDRLRNKEVTIYPSTLSYKQRSGINSIEVMKLEVMKLERQMSQGFHTDELPGLP